MNQLVERMLAIGSRFAPVNWTCVMRHSLPIESHVLAIALHRQLLQVSWEPFQILLIGQHRHSLRLKEIGVPDRQKAHKHGQIFFEGRDRKSTRLNSSHLVISYAVFCLK